MKLHSVTLALAATLLAACGGSDKYVKTQNTHTVDSDGDVHQQTTTTTTSEDGEVLDVKKDETKIHDD